MKYIICLISFFVISLSAYSEESLLLLSETPADASSEIGGAFSVGFEQMVSTVSPMTNLSLTYEYFFAKNVSVSYSLGLGMNSKYPTLKTTLGIAALFYGLAHLGYIEKSNSSSCDYCYTQEEYDECMSDKRESTFGALFFLALLPEGINFYINPEKPISFQVFLNFFGFETDENGGTMTGSLGMKFGIKLAEKAILQPMIGAKMKYNGNSPAGFICGLSIKAFF